jgi:hypothetical protein
MEWIRDRRAAIYRQGRSRLAGGRGHKHAATGTRAAVERGQPLDLGVRIRLIDGYVGHGIHLLDVDRGVIIYSGTLPNPW